MNRTIYVLVLENGKYYVGSTRKPIAKRIQEHKNGYGSEWTKLHRPITVGKCCLQFTAEKHKLDEDTLVEQFMHKHGINNVRGGSYSQIRLPMYQIRTIERKFIHADNACHTCFRSGHFAKNCPFKYHPLPYQSTYLEHYYLECAQLCTCQGPCRDCAQSSVDLATTKILLQCFDLERQLKFIATVGVQDRRVFHLRFMDVDEDRAMVPNIRWCVKDNVCRCVVEMIQQSSKNSRRGVAWFAWDEFVTGCAKLEVADTFQLPLHCLHDVNQWTA